MTSSKLEPSPSIGAEFISGIVITLPFILGAIPFAIIFGILATNAGLSVLETSCMSLFVFSGSAQFIAVSLMAAGAEPWVIWMATLILNLRHTLYAATLVPYVRHLSLGWRLVLSTFLTDETFATIEARYREMGGRRNTHWAFLGSCVSMYVNWNLWTLGAALAGRKMVGLAGSGLEFAVIAAFIGMIVPKLKDRPAIVAAFTAGAIAVFGAWLPYKLGLTLAAIFGIGAAAMVEGRRSQVARQ